ncbi:MAG TPA: DUF6701 domain-containing protein [Gammaproteobacteria bacterium]|nr:DUF6701 domain-containing protein [Gammaproteobacteria bacterium]
MKAITYSILRAFRYLAGVLLFCNVLTVNAAVLFTDDFESGYNWTASDGSRTGVSNQTSSSPSNSMFTRGGTVTSTSPVINTAGASSLSVDMWIRRGDDSFSEDPDNNEDLEVGYINNVGTFIVLETFIGNNPAGEIFTRTYNITNSDAFHANFQVRVRQTNGNNGNFDYWHIDDVTVSGTVLPSSCSFNSGLSSGITGYYFNNMTLTSPAAGTRIDGPVNFDWGGGSPGVAGVGNNNFSVRWEGVLRITSTDTYRFQTVSDDGVRLWVDGNLVIDNWTDHAATTDTSGNVALTAGQIYEIRLEYYENGGQSEIRLRWGRVSGGFVYTPIPAGPSPTFGQGLYYCSVPAAVAEWRMDETTWNGTPGEVVDETGTYNGTAVNGAITDSVDPAIAGTPGTCGYGFFDGNDDYVDVGNISTILNDTASLTFWIKTTQTGNDTGWMAPGVTGVEESGGSDDIFWGWLDGSGHIGISVANDFTSKSSVPINDDNWHHVALTRDASDGSYKIYIDGNLDTSGTIGAGVIGNAYSSIGRIEDTGGSPEYFNGNLDEVRVYDAVLADVDVIAIRDNTHPCVSVGTKMEVDTVTLNDTTVTASFTTATFNQTYTTPPLVFVLPTNEGSDPSSIRIRNVTTTGFEITQVEPDNLDGPHPAMTVDYLAIEEGTLTLPDGRILEAGSVPTNEVQHGAGVPGPEGWETINFATTFSGTPAVLAQIQTMVNETANPPATSSVPWLVTAVQNVSATGVELALERAEVDDLTPPVISNNETVGYLAVEGNVQGSFVSGVNVLYETIVSADNIQGWDNENCAGSVGQAVPFVNTYSTIPLAIAHQNTHDGGDGGWVRRCNISTTQINLAVDEDTFRDSERNHTTERAGVLVFSEAFCIPACVIAVDHYEISFPNGSIGITCEPSEVQITAHDSSDNPIAVPGGTTLDITSVIDGTPTLSGEWDNATGGGSLSGNPGNPVTYTWPASPEENSVTLELRQLATGTLDINLDDGVATELEDPTIEFREAIFRVVDAAAVPVAITTKLSGKQSNTAGTGFQNLFLQAIETNDSLECQFVFENQNDVTIQMASECNNPVGCESVNVEVEDDSGILVPIAANSNASVGTYTDIQFDFDADSKTPLRFVYDDAGQITLHARFDIDDPNNVFMQGDSGPFVVKPAGLCVESTDTDSDCASGDGTCSAFIKADDIFNLTVRGVTWESDAETDSDFCTGSNSTTPNFELSGITLSHNLIAPGGGDPGSLGISNADIVNADQGSVTLSSQTISEVGVFTVTAIPPLYIGETISSSGSANIGRFIPDRFVVVSDGSPAFADECTTGTPFTYLDQTYRYGSPPALTLQALNINGVVTQKYGQDFWKLAVTDLDRSYNDNAGAAASFAAIQDNTVTVTGDTDLDGQGTLTLDAGTNGDAFMYTRVAEEGEFSADADVTFSGFTGNVANTDDLTDTDSVCHDSDNDDVCDDYTINNITGATLRFGRLVIGTAFGSELLPLRPVFRTQYFDSVSGSFITNTDDGCTSVAATDLSLSSAFEGPETDGDVVITSGGTCPGPGNGCTTATLGNEPFVEGDGALEFSAPGAGNTGSADITIDLSTVPLGTHANMNWLRYDWDDDDGAGDGPYDDDPDGRATFGIYQGPSEYIYIREPW